MPKNPYYLVLRALNLGHKLTKKEEERISGRPDLCLLYARKVLKGRLPDHLHNRMVLEVWADENDQEAAKTYLQDFAGNS